MRTGLGLRGMGREGARGLLFWAHKSIHIHCHTDHTHTQRHRIGPDTHMPRTTHNAAHLCVTPILHTWTPVTCSFTHTRQMLTPVHTP